MHGEVAPYIIECTKIKKLWQSLTRWIDYMFQHKIEFTPELIIYNDHKLQHKQMFNCFILICKQYSYSTKCQKNDINFRTMLSKIHEAERIEARIARSKSKYAQHYNKWHLLITS